MAATASQRLRVRGITNFKFVLWLVLIFYAQLAGFGTEFAAQVGSAGFNLMGWTYPVAKAAAEAMKVSSRLLAPTPCSSFLLPRGLLRLACSSAGVLCRWAGLSGQAEAARA